MAPWQKSSRRLNMFHFLGPFRTWQNNGVVSRPHAESTGVAVQSHILLWTGSSKVKVRKLLDALGQTLDQNVIASPCFLVHIAGLLFLRHIGSGFGTLLLTKGRRRREVIGWCKVKQPFAILTWWVLGNFGAIFRKSQGALSHHTAVPAPSFFRVVMFASRQLGGDIRILFSFQSTFYCLIL